MKAPIIYIPNAIKSADLAFKDLRDNLAWEKREGAPRWEYYCNDFPKPYTYGRGAGRREYQPQPCTPTIWGIRQIAERLADEHVGKRAFERGVSTMHQRFEVCFLNLYRDQKDQLGWHADDSPEMDDNRSIAIVSLGVERDIMFRQILEPGRYSKEVEALKLQHGSLCLMIPGMQDTWQHRIPKAGFTCGERISLTFRGYVPEDRYSLSEHFETLDDARHANGES